MLLPPQGQRGNQSVSDDAQPMFGEPAEAPAKDFDFRYNVCVAVSRESVAINASLMTLGRCLENLRWNQQHPGGEQRLVPYREARVRA